MTQSIYINGAFVSKEDALISVYDGGYLHGAGLFETMRAENGCVFRFESHMERMVRSASKLFAPIERDALPSQAVFRALLERNNLDAARVRLTVSAGTMDAELGEAMPQLSICATAVKLSAYPRDFYERGVTVAICPFRVSPTDPIAGHKTTGFLPRLLGLREARQAHCTEAIWFTTANQLAEGSISNVFVVHDGVLKTPPIDTPVLPGITRRVIQGIASDTDIEAVECPLSIDDLLDADEVLLTNTIMQVIPVTRVEKHDIGDGRVGPMAGRLLDDYRQLVKRECTKR